jgi:hypothetical protein
MTPYKISILDNKICVINNLVDFEGFGMFEVIGSIKALFPSSYHK